MMAKKLDKTKEAFAWGCLGMASQNALDSVESVQDTFAILRDKERATIQAAIESIRASAQLILDVTEKRMDRMFPNESE